MQVEGEVVGGGERELVGNGVCVSVCECVPICE